MKTFAQTLTASLVVATGLHNVAWLVSLSAAGLAALLSVLTSVGSGKVTADGSPDLSKGE